MGKRKKEVADIVRGYDIPKQPRTKVSADTRRRLILEEIARGAKLSDIVDKYSEEWGVKFQTIKYYIVSAMKEMYDEETTESLRQINLERLDNIISAQIESGDYKNAIKSIDIQNKTANIYKEKVELDTKDIEFKLKF